MSCCLFLCLYNNIIINCVFCLFPHNIHVCHSNMYLQPGLKEPTLNSQALSLLIALILLTVWPLLTSLVVLVVVTVDLSYLRVLVQLPKVILLHSLTREVALISHPVQETTTYDILQPLSTDSGELYSSKDPCTSLPNCYTMNEII